jgi:hypothetical protein
LRSSRPAGSRIAKPRDFQRQRHQSVRDEFAEEPATGHLKLPIAKAAEPPPCSRPLSVPLVLSGAMKPLFPALLALALGYLLPAGRAADAIPINYDEAKVGTDPLPDPLTFANGRAVKSTRAWRERRQELLELFQTYVYGRSPGRPRDQSFAVTATEAQALGGLATRREVDIRLSGKVGDPVIHLLLYVPNGATSSVPVMLGLNFEGNQCVHPEPGITLPTAWMRDHREAGIVSNRATEQSRGCQTSRWNIEKILRRGYAFATVYYGDLEPDHPEGWKSGVRSAFPVAGGRPVAKAREPITALADDAWGAIGAWAWGLSRVVDYFETDPAVDARKVVLMGHSRLGKTALWAGATDERFAIIISNNSGEGGAALARRDFGENVRRINTSFPHWFNGNFKRYSTNVAALPVDQHELIALIAPRPVYVASAEQDKWADPRGEFLAAKAASPVYRLFGTDGLTATEWPAVHQPVHSTIGYHLRAGAHDVLDYDWDQWLAFADRHLPTVKRR